MRTTLISLALLSTLISTAHSAVVKKTRNLCWSSNHTNKPCLEFKRDIEKFNIEVYGNLKTNSSRAPDLEIKASCTYHVRKADEIGCDGADAYYQLNVTTIVRE